MHNASPAAVLPVSRRPSLTAFFKSHFAPAFCFLTPERRHGLKVVYAFFRVLDDAVDEAKENPAPLIEAWLAAIREKRPAAVEKWGHAPLAGELIAAMDRFGVPAFALEDFLTKGVASDLGSVRFETAMDTERYCYGVAGTVGIACLPIFGASVADARDFAIRLGIAVQWINIVRDVGVDAKLGRIYLPLDHLERFGVRPEDVLAGRSSSEFLALMRHEADVARSHHRRAMELLPPQWKKELRPALVMGRIYLDLLGKVERKGFRVFTNKVSLNIVEKVLSTWRALRG